nr:histone H2A [Tanacetum cinerariifolium]
MISIPIEEPVKIKKGAAGRKAGGLRKKSVTRSVKARLQFPVGRIGSPRVSRNISVGIGRKCSKGQ